MNAMNIARLMAIKQCTYSKCKKQFPDGIIHMSGKYGQDFKLWPDGEYLFHCQDTHGFPPEMMVEEIERLVNAPMRQEDVDAYNRTIKEELKKRGRTE